MKKKITLTIGSTEFKFEVNVQAHSGFVDGVAMGGSMTANAHTFVMRSIDADQKDDIKKLLEDSPGAEIQIAGLLKGEYSPQLEISVKK